MPTTRYVDNITQYLLADNISKLDANLEHDLSKTEFGFY